MALSSHLKLRMIDLDEPDAGEDQHRLRKGDKFVKGTNMKAIHGLRPLAAVKPGLASNYMANRPSIFPPAAPAFDIFVKKIGTRVRRFGVRTRSRKPT